jgi:adenylate cyclase
MASVIGVKYWLRKWVSSDAVSPSEMVVNDRMSQKSSVSSRWFAFSRHGILIEPTYPAFSAAAVYFAGVSTLYAVKRHQEREIRSAFGRFVSPAVV